MGPWNESEQRRRMVEQRRARDIRDGLVFLTHERGNCGMECGALCGECYQDEVAALIGWAKEQPAPLDGETWRDYWRRIDGPLLDAYGDAARAVIGGRHTQEAQRP